MWLNAPENAEGHETELAAFLDIDAAFDTNSYEAAASAARRNGVELTINR
jgi:hypothetical protein